MIETIERQARFLVLIGYARDAVIAQLEREFPGEDAAGAYEAAVAFKAEQEQKIGVELQKHDDAAVQAEHDLSKTMHRRWGE